MFSSVFVALCTMFSMTPDLSSHCAAADLKGHNTEAAARHPPLTKNNKDQKMDQIIMQKSYWTNCHKHDESS
jgi:hypothetical protein